MTFWNRRHFCHFCHFLGLSLVLTLTLLSLPALAQTQFSGQITSNVNGAAATLANPGSWTAVPAVSTLKPGDLVTPQLSANGVGCTNEIPLTVYFITQYTANVSANLNNLASGASGTNAFVRFSLQNCGTYNPQITGTSVILAYQQNRVLGIMKLWLPWRFVVNWLNEPGHPDSTAWFVDLIETTQRLTALAALRASLFKLSSEDERSIAELIVHINTLLSEHRPTHLRLWGLHKGVFVSPKGLLVANGHDAWSSPGYVHFRDIFQDMERDDAEWYALESLKEIAEEGALERLRRCKLEKCARWFYARSRLQKFCSDKCKQKEKRSSPEWKKDRARYMRDYYEKHLRKVHFVKKRKRRAPQA
jgi:hypothetical protein